MSVLWVYFGADVRRVSRLFCVSQPETALKQHTLYQAFAPDAGRPSPDYISRSLSLRVHRILADQKITSISTLRTVLHTLHTTHKVSNVIITSVALPASDLVLIGASETLADGRPAMLQVGSSLDPNEGSSKKLKPWFIQFPEIQGYFTGVGDLFSALTLARFQPNDKQGVQGPSADTPNPDPSATGISNDYKSLTPLARAAEMAVASLQGVLARTQAAIDSAPAIPSIEPASSGAGNAEDSATVAEAQLRVERMRRRELRVVQSRQEIERPDVNHRARWLRLP